MNRFTVVTATALALAAAAPLLATTTTPASAQGPRDSEMSDRELLELFVDRFRSRREMRELLEDRIRERDRDGEVRERFRERFSERRDRDRGRDDDDDDGDDDRSARGGHMRERMAHFRRGRGGGGDGCYFVTRSVRSAGGDFFALTRRRICRD
jgi:hypothetical protein